MSAAPTMLPDDGLDRKILRALDLPDEGIPVPKPDTAHLYLGIQNRGGLVRLFLACEKLRQRGLIDWMPGEHGRGGYWKLTVMGRLEVRTQEGGTSS